jgi:hypothetical protein
MNLAGLTLQAPNLVIAGKRGDFFIRFLKGSRHICRDFDISLLDLSFMDDTYISETKL